MKTIKIPNIKGKHYLPDSHLLRVHVGETAAIDIEDVGIFTVVGVPFNIYSSDSCDKCPIVGLELLNASRCCVCAKGAVLHSVAKIMEEL